MKKFPNISYSALSLYKTCPYQFYLNYLQDEIEEAASCKYFSLIGTLWQYIFEKITNDRMYRKYSPDEIISMVKKDLTPTLNKLIVDISEKEDTEIVGVGFYSDLKGQFALDTKNKTLDDVEDEFPTIYPALNKWLSKPAGLLDMFECEPYFKSKHTTSKGNEYNMSGYVDFLFRGKEKLSVVDGKRNTFVEYDKEDTKKQNPKFPFISPVQLHFYVLLTESIDNFDSLSFWDYTKNKIIKVPTTKQDVLNTKKMIDDTVDKIKAETKWEQKPSTSNCKFCSYKPHCNEKMKNEGLEL